MKRLDRYIVREMLVPFLIGTVAVVLMFQINELIALYKNFNLSAVPMTAVLQVILFKTPTYLNMTLPVGVSLASSLAISRLTRESELTAIRSAGVSILRVVRPVMVAGVLVAGLNFWVAESIMPSATRKAFERQSDIGTLALNPEFKANVVQQVGEYLASIGSVERGQEGAIKLTDILLITHPRVGETLLITAPSGSYKGGVWVIRQPYLRMFKDRNLVDAKPDQDMLIQEPIRIEQFFGQGPIPEQQSITQLKNAIEMGKKARQDMTMQEVGYYVRFSVPAACIVFALTGPVFAVWLARSGAFIGVLLSIVLVLIYYNVFIVSTEIIGRNGWLDPMLSAWLPNILFAVLGFFALRRAE
ncbi:MAG TPA: LptF/LptG family permease [Fimbriimonadaceae bacterium]|nr:LptF/LptG family permease [Fimbriimonadaceae bacterium]HRJ95149.1 LptF/LptG family permease [Fimbriimonadaceae bacterium]